MATESDNEEFVLTYNEFYYEELASEEEIYLEETEEELRSELISDTPSAVVPPRRQSDNSER